MNKKVATGGTRSALAEDIEDYLAYCKAKGRSSKTLAHYTRILRGTANSDGHGILLQWCEEHEITELRQLETKTLDRLSGELQGRGITANSAHSYLRTIATFLAWAKESGLDGADRTGRVSKPKLGEKAVAVLTRSEMERLQAQAAKKPGGHGRRDSLIINVLINTGMRADELCRLRWPQDLVETEDGNLYLRLQGKGNKERLVPIDRHLAGKIRQYIKLDRPQDIKTDRLFVSYQRSPKTKSYEPLTPSGIRSMISTAGEDAGFEQPVYTHLLRHSFATDYLIRNRDPVSLRRILGHASLEMIDRTYTHLANADLSDAMAEYRRRLVVSNGK